MARTMLWLLLFAAVSGCAGTGAGADGARTARVLSLISYYEQPGPSQRPDLRLIGIERRERYGDREIEHWTVELDGRRSRYEVSFRPDELARGTRIDVQKLQ